MVRLHRSPNAKEDVVPYIKADLRVKLDPLIEPIVKYVQEMLSKDGNYLLIEQYIVCELALQTYSLINHRQSGSPNRLNPFYLTMHANNLGGQILFLAKNIKEMTFSYNCGFGGLFNYCCTAIILEPILHSQPRPDYNLWLDVSAICTRVGSQLDQIFETRDTDGSRLCGLFLNHIPNEVYRRLIALYEDSKIKSNGDVSGYAKHSEQIQDIIFNH